MQCRSGVSRPLNAYLSFSLFQQLLFRDPTHMLLLLCQEIWFQGRLILLILASRNRWGMNFLVQCDY